jgi:hypothetical protein
MVKRDTRIISFISLYISKRINYIKYFFNYLYAIFYTRLYTKNKLLFIILLLLLLFLSIHTFSNYINEKNKVREGLAVIDDIKDAFSELSKIKNFAEKIPKEVSSIKNEIVDSANVVKNSVNQIDNKLEDFLKKVKKTTIDIVTDKIYGVLKQIGDIFNDGLINPIVVLFKGISNIFIGIFGILKEIANKIASLPKCILPYMIFSIISTIQSIYSSIIPNIIRTSIYTLHTYTLKYITDRLYIWLDIDKYNSCYRFGVTDEINKIESNAKKISDAFSNDFGRLDFSKIKV